MNTLFPVESHFPSGFNYIPDYISKTEEEMLIKEVMYTELKTFVFQGFEAKRRVASFGYDYSFDKGRLSKGKEIPPAFYPVISRVAKTLEIEASAFAELLVTEYPVGAVINWHRDAPPFGIIAGISLNADCVFKLRPHAAGKPNNSEDDVVTSHKRSAKKSHVINVPVARRSLYVIRDEARSAWQHSTAPVKEIRYSITLRTLA